MRLSDPNVSILVGFILLLVVAGFTSYYAEKKGRNPVVWFVISLLFGVLAPLVLFMLPQVSKEEQPSPSVYPTPIENSPPQPPALDANKKLNGQVEDKLWYYLDTEHQQYGPVSIIGLQELWNTGKLDLNSYVWAEEMKTWELVDNLPELKEALGKVQI